MLLLVMYVLKMKRIINLREEFEFDYFFGSRLHREIIRCCCYQVWERMPLDMICQLGLVYSSFFHAFTISLWIWALIGDSKIWIFCVHLNAEIAKCTHEGFLF